MAMRTHVSMLACAVGLAVSSPALAKPFTVEPVAADGQSVRYQQGVGSIVSEGDASDVWASPTSKSFDKRLTLTIGVENKSARPADIDTSSIQVFTAEGEPLEVFTLERLEKEARSKAAWAGIGVALAGAVVGAASSYDTSSTSFGRSVYKVKSFNPAVAQAVTDSAADAAGQIQAGLGSRLDELGKTMLQRTTVDARDTGGGYVTIGAPPKSATALKVRVEFAGEVHELTFNIRR